MLSLNLDFLGKKDANEVKICQKIDVKWGEIKMMQEKKDD